MVGRAVAFCVALIAFSSASMADSQVSALAEPPRHIWMYHYEETRSEFGASLSIIGTKFEYVEPSYELVVDNERVPTMKLVLLMTADVTGTMVVYEPVTGGITHDIVGTYSARWEGHYDRGTGFLMRSTEDAELVTEGASETQPYLGLYHRVHNETEYSSIECDPSGFNPYDEGLDLEPGSSWTLEIRSTSEVEGVNGTTPFEESFVVNRSAHYTCEAIESVEVPAGTFECVKFVIIDGETLITRWHCPSVYNDAMNTLTSSQGESTASLVDYEICGGVCSQIFDSSLVYAWALVITVAVILVTVVLLMAKKDREKLQPPTNTGLMR